ncbi:hypothetical protein SAMN05444143_11317 [Flavobacterium succinicans]|uniref:Uncharacterized protein n=1 Tax=Flavobacterium succinicans TaxID=29536 RepID=A0A1I4YYW7_9FLAO|nr:DUF5713 family protein [Flavobacterium succinicans]SFN42993.1 hypothetical protein SAMN05444143_11317 [Flavobacterium succinicans]
MKAYFIAIISLILFSCNGQQATNQNTIIKQENLKNDKLKNYAYLKDMYTDSYFPKFLVDKVKIILIELCIDIEKTAPKNLDELYKLTYTATKKINDLQNEFSEQNSEIETGARESIATDFDFIAKAYGFNADSEELIAPREW